MHDSLADPVILKSSTDNRELIVESTAWARNMNSMEHSAQWVSPIAETQL